MSEIIVTDGQPSADFAAGVATVVAGQAVEEAQEAQVEAAVSARAAEEAAGAASEAASDALAAELTVSALAEELDALRQFTHDGFAAVSVALADVEDEVDEVEDLAAAAGAPPIETAQETPPAQETPSPKAKRAKQTRMSAFTNSPFFRGRA